MLIDLTLLTTVHTALSFIALALGFAAVSSLMSDGMPRVWITVFLAVSALVTVTGFLFPFVSLTPALLTGIVASVVLALTFVARFIGGYAGMWRIVYAAGIVINAWLMVFVSIAQVFTKTPALGLGPAFGVTQLAALVIFAYIGLRAVKPFKA